MEQITQQKHKSCHQPVLDMADTRPGCGEDRQPPAGDAHAQHWDENTGGCWPSTGISLSAAVTPPPLSAAPCCAPPVWSAELAPWPPLLAGLHRLGPSAACGSRPRPPGSQFCCQQMSHNITIHTIQLETSKENKLIKNQILTNSQTKVQPHTQIEVEASKENQLIENHILTNSQTIIQTPLLNTFLIFQLS